MCAQPLLALRARVLRDHDLDRQTDHPADHRVGDAGIPGRAVQDGLAAPEPTVGERAQHHPQYGTVLKRAARVEALHLGEHLDSR